MVALACSDQYDMYLCIACGSFLHRGVFSKSGLSSVCAGNLSRHGNTAVNKCKGAIPVTKISKSASILVICCIELPLLLGPRLRPLLETLPRLAGLMRWRMLSSSCRLRVGVEVVLVLSCTSYLLQANCPSCGTCPFLAQCILGVEARGLGKSPP